MAGRGGRPSAFKIEPFKHPIALDPHYADKTWRVLESAIREIHNKNASGLSFEELYRNAYNMVLHKHGDRLYSGVAEALHSHLAVVASRIEAAQGLPFLRELVTCWNEHNKSTQMIRDILMYMDRTYVTQQHKTQVFQLGLDLWREQVVRQRTIHARLLAIVGDLVARERSGEMVDRVLLRAVTQMLSDLGKLTYQEDFEEHFLTAAAQFYQKEAQDWIASCSAPEYFVKAERRLEEEAERVRAYLDESTEPKITQVAEAELIQQQMQKLAEMEGSGLISLLCDERTTDLGRMYGLFRRVAGGLELLRSMMGAHIEDEGRKVVNDPDKLKDAQLYVDALLRMRDKYERIIATAFADDKTFKNTLNAAFERFLNEQSRSHEFISLFIDRQLTGGAKATATTSEAELDLLLDKVMALFRYLQDKMMFDTYYKNHLGKRLLSAKGVSDDLERTMMMKLKSECGYTYTQKMEAMYTDIRTSRDMMTDFAEKCRQEGVALPIDMAVSVLTTGAWPSAGVSHCILPAEMQQASAAFEEYYTATHNGRKLTWAPSMGHAEVKFATDKPYVLQVSPYQAAVLMLFNSAQQMSYADIHAATQVPHADLKRALQSLACVPKTRILRKTPQSKEVGDADEFAVNAEFTSKTIRVRLMTISSQQERPEEKQETREQVEADRHPLVDAAIVRALKSRKTMSHNDVITEVTTQLRNRFLPSSNLIKKRIEHLIEREFLERSPDDRKMYVYMA